MQIGTSGRLRVKTSGAAILRAIALSPLTFGLAMGALAATPKTETEKPKLEIREVTPAPVPAGAPVTPLVQAGDASWCVGKPIWSGQSKDVGARFWMATTTHELLIRVTVTSPRQSNPYHERDLWRGDCLYVSLDARNDTTPEELKSGAFGPDDATFIFGLGSQGPEGRASKHGDPIEAAKEQTDLIRGIVRDDAAQTTTYDLAIPYERLSTTFAMSPAVGVALCVAHKDAEGKDQNWGQIAASKDAPRQLHVIAVATGKDPLVEVAPRRIRLADPKAAAEVTVAVRTSKAGSLRAMLVESEQAGPLSDEVLRSAAATTLKVPGDEALHRYSVLAPAVCITPLADRLVVAPDLAEPEDQTQHSYLLTTPETLMARFGRHLAKLEAAAGDNALLREHLDSTRRVVQDAHDRLASETLAHPERAQEFLDQVELIDSKLPADKYDWAWHVARAIPLVFAFSSEADGTLQFYSLQLPFGYEEGKTYPLTVYLHGAGDQNPLGGLSTSFDNSHQDTLFRTVEIDPAQVPPSHRGLVLAPWARGNSMYRGNGEADVYQSMELVRKRFQVDPDSVYLTGFSMGCSGAMGIAARRPELFAGVGLASGFGTWSDTNRPDLVDKLRGMAVAVWIGELDGMADDARAFDALLTKKNIEHRFGVLPKTPHTYPYDEFQKNVGYLMQFARKQPK